MAMATGEIGTAEEAETAIAIDGETTARRMLRETGTGTATIAKTARDPATDGIAGARALLFARETTSVVMTGREVPVKTEWTVAAMLAGTATGIATTRAIERAEDGTTEVRALAE